MESSSQSVGGMAVLSLRHRPAPFVFYGAIRPLLPGGGGARARATAPAPHSFPI